MSPERWQQVDRVFQMALERPQEDRGPFLDRFCPDDSELRHEVRRMLAGDEDAHGFLETPAAELTARMIAEDSRQLAPGTMIGPYEVQLLLGSGGMGDVYKARDTRLGRTVAIKVLPMGTMASPERRQRFLGEAQAASALNHPHIVTIHDVLSEGGRDCIVMEYLDGETLDTLIARKEMDLRDAVQYAIQIADALAAAHAAGIVHRDIKPGNIMAVASGSDRLAMKVLDFGLAKQAAVGSALTQEGLIMGTVAYMSPEQAEGRKVDTRSDIFSFGALLYEMTTTRKAFQGATGASTMAAILRDEPQPAGEISPHFPRELDWVITLCLKKQPQRRWQSTPDLKVALEEALDKIDPAAKAGFSGTFPLLTEVAKQPGGGLYPARTEVSPPPPPPRRRIPLWFWGVAASGAALALFGGGYWGRKTAPANIPMFERLTYRRGDVTSARFTPDGQTIIYAAEWDAEPSTIFSTRPGSRESRSLGLPPGKILSMSPAGEMAILWGTLGSTLNPGMLSRAPVAGGTPREVLEGVIDADWADASRLAVVRSQEGKSRAEFPVGNVVFETSEAVRPLYSLRVSPTGDALAFFYLEHDLATSALYFLPRGGAPKILTGGWRSVGRLVWTPDGKEIWFVASTSGGDTALRAVSRTGGSQRIVTRTPGQMVIHDVAKDGRVLAAESSSRIDMFTGGGAEQEDRDLSWLDTSWVFDISNDGKILLFAELSSGNGQNPAIYSRKTDGSPAVRLGNCARPSLSPDSKWVACIQADTAGSKITFFSVGAGEPYELPTSGLHYERVEWMPDGQHVLFVANEPGKSARSYVQAVSGGGPPAAVTPEGIIARRVSPDSKSAIGIHDGGLFVFDLKTGAKRQFATAEPGEFAVRWCSDGRSVFTASRGGTKSFLVYRVDTTTGQRRLWKKLKPADTVGVTMDNLVVTPDGRSYAYSYQRDLSDLYLISGLH